MDQRLRPERQQISASWRRTWVSFLLEARGSMTGGMQMRIKTGVQILRPKCMLVLSRSPPMGSHPNSVHLPLLSTLLKALEET